MIADAPYRSGGQKESHVQGWLISVLLHGTIAFTVILAVKQIQLTPQDDAFKWNVAMVSPAQQIQPTASSSTQAFARSAPSTTSTSSPPLRRGTPTQTLTQQAAPSPPQLTTPLPSATHTIQSVEPIKHEAAAAESLVKPDDTPTAVSSSTDAVTGPSSTQSTAVEQTPRSEQGSEQTQMAAISPAPTNVPDKRDYGWLSEMIIRRMEELKRYPASARVDRAEGKVVVKAVIGEDGSISEVGVFLSSGHIALDEAAVETMRQAAPLHLPHPLGQPRMTIKIPMSYRLDR
ncbi:MAG: energy transducer TonB [Nitrospira sp.]|nr:MAG: energy transducer TonB [Nitrospira sp.]